MRFIARCGVNLWLALFWFCLPQAQAGDVNHYQVTKGIVYSQSDAGQPTVLAAGGYRFTVAVSSSSPVGLTNGTVQPPGKPVITLLTSGRRSLGVNRILNSPLGLAQQCPDGSYSLVMQSINDGTVTVPLTLTSNDFPVPHVVNFGALTNISAEAAFLLQWDPFTNATAADWIKVTIKDAQDQPVFQTSDPLTEGQTGLLAGTNTSVIIPGDTLNLGQTNLTGQITFYKCTRNTNSYPSVVGVAGWTRTTTFAMRTLDVRNYGVLKGLLMTQTGPATLTTNGYYFDAFVNSSAVVGTNNVFVGSASFVGQTWSPLVYQALDGPDYYTEQGPYATMSALNAAYNALGYPSGGYPNGIHAIKISTRHDGNKTLTGLSLTGDNYPTVAPRFNNFNALLTVNANGELPLSWNAMGGTTNDYVQVEIDDLLTNVVWETPEQGELGALNGTNTSVNVPAETLAAGSNYVIYLTFEKHNLYTNGYPGAVGIAGYYCQSMATLKTVDIAAYGIMKSATYVQTNAGAPLLDHYSFEAFIDARTNTASLGKVVLTGPTAKTYSLDATNKFDYSEDFATASLLNAAYPAGAYRLALQTLHDGALTVTNTLGADNYPAATAQIANYAALQNINAGADFTLTWLPIAGATTNHFVWVLVDEWGSGESVFASIAPGAVGALNGASTSVVIPAGTLRTGYSYVITIVYGTTPPDAASYPGAFGLAGFVNQTQVIIKVPGTAYTKQVALTDFSNNQITVRADGEVGRVSILESAPYLTNAWWTPLATNIALTNGTFTHTSPIAPGTNQYYRLRDSTAAGP